MMISVGYGEWSADEIYEESGFLFGLLVRVVVAN